MQRSKIVATNFIAVPMVVPVVVVVVPVVVAAIVVQLKRLKMVLICATAGCGRHTRSS